MEEKEFMQFIDEIQFFERRDNAVWIILYKSIKDSKNDSVIYSCLLKKEFSKESLKSESWDFSIQSIQGAENVIPLLVKRHFYGLKEDYWEITEDIRLFFNLFEDKANRKFLYIDDNGDEEEVIVFSEKEIKIKKLYLIEYLHERGLAFAQFFDFRRFSEKSLEELGLRKKYDKKSGTSFIYSIGLNNNELSFGDWKSTASVTGKKIVEVPNSFKTTIFSDEKEYQKFVIGVDKSGKEITFTCNEEQLNNYFGKNKGKPHYLTQVFFKKEVLDKYYNNSEKYSVSDGYLSCQGLWGLRMDNSHTNIVMVFLGDLGHLSSKEQKHWEQYNITDGKISRSCFKRSFEAEFCDPDTADLVFKQKFKIFQENWHKKYGWHLFKPLIKADEHYFQTLRLPTKNSQQEFDGLVLAVTKIIIDSINVRKMKERMVSEDSGEYFKKLIKDEFVLKKGDKSIEVLKKYLSQKHTVQFPEMVSFMKNLQELRSSSSAHRKGKKYEKIKKKFGLSNNYQTVFKNILIEGIKILNTLSNKKYRLIS